MGIFDILRASKSSNELHAALEAVTAEIEARRATIAGLKVKLRTAPFEASAPDVATLRQQMRAAEDDLEMLLGVEEETKSRREAAAKAESESNIRQEMKSARKDRDAMRLAALEYDKHIAGAVAAADEMRSLSGRIAAANAVAIGAGFEHLRLRYASFGHDIARGEAIGALRQLSPTPSFNALEAGGKL
jgi:DNA repair exonuclease SbcCD ATPase subunit